MIRPSTPISATSAMPVTAKSKPMRRSIAARLDRERAPRAGAARDGAGGGDVAISARTTVNELSIVEWLSPQYSRQRIR